MTVLPQLKHDLLEAARDTLPGEGRRAPWRWVSGGDVVASLSVATALAIAVLAIVLIGTGGHDGRRATAAGAPHRGSSLARIERTPYVRQLLRHFAIFRRPQTAADRSWAGGQRRAPGRELTVTPVAGLTRLATTVAGRRIFLTVDRDYEPVRRAGERQPFRLDLDVNLLAGRAGVLAAPWNANVDDYTHFPVRLRALTYAFGEHGPTTAVSIVPDGVAHVIWRFACSIPAACDGRHSLVIRPRLHGNVAAAVIPSSVSVPYVTWLSARGRPIARFSTFPRSAREARPFP